MGRMDFFMNCNCVLRISSSLINGVKRWADHGQRMRNNGRHLGALADFFGDRAGVVDAEALARAFALVRQDCTVRAEATPLAYEYCRPLPEDTVRTEERSRADAPVLEPV